MLIRVTRDHSVEVELIKSKGHFHLVKSVPASKWPYSVVNDLGITVGYCRYKAQGIRAIARLHEQFNSRLNIPLDECTQKLYDEIRTFYFYSNDIWSYK